MASRRNLGRIIGSIYIVAHNSGGNVCKNVKAMQMPQALGASKSQTNFFFDVGGIHFTPSMTIVLVVHALHLSKMAS
jgi:hypothetical protein